MSGTYQCLPGLSDDEYKALEKSIVEHGIQVPILVDENKTVIDGHHRQEIADRLGIECPRKFALDLSDAEKRTLALSLNLDRRHLTREQKRQVVEDSLKADPQLSDRQHAERTGVSPTTVGTARARLEDCGDVSNLDTRADSLGRQQPAKQPKKAKPRREYVREFCRGTIALDSCLRKLESLVGEDGFKKKHREQAREEAVLIKEIINRASKLLAELEG